MHLRTCYSIGSEDGTKWLTYTNDTTAYFSNRPETATEYESPEQAKQILVEVLSRSLFVWDTDEVDEDEGG